MSGAHVAGPKPAWQTIGFWMAIPMGLLQAVNAARAALDPSGFADYLGAPLAAPADESWVHVYALRTAFIAILVAIFVIRQNLSVLAWIATAALIMPLGDAWIAHSADAPIATVARHGAIAVYLAVAILALHAGARAVARANP